MKHSQWLRLKADSVSEAVATLGASALASLRASGDKIVMALRAEGYHCRKQTHRLSWTFRKHEVSYSLTWLPAPVSEWSLLPNDATPEREKLLSEIRSVLNTYRAGGRLTKPLNEVESFADSTSPASNQGDRANHTTASGDRFWNQDNYPWIIVRLLPNAQRYVVARFYSRSEAENHKRLLNRFMPAADFEVVFDASPAVALDTHTKIPVY